MIAEPCERQYHLYSAELKEVNNKCLRVSKSIRFLGKCDTFETAKKKAEEFGLLLIDADSDVIATLPLEENRDSYVPLKYSYRKKDEEKPIEWLGGVSRFVDAFSVAENYAWNYGIPFARN